MATSNSNSNIKITKKCSVLSDNRRVSILSSKKKSMISLEKGSGSDGV